MVRACNPTLCLLGCKQPPLAPSESERTAALTFALTHVLHTAGKDRGASVVVLYEPPAEDAVVGGADSGGADSGGAGAGVAASASTAFSSTLSPVPVSLCSVLTPASHFKAYTFRTFDDLLGFVATRLHVFETTAGVMCLVYSAILSRGIEQVLVGVHAGVRHCSAAARVLVAGSDGVGDAVLWQMDKEDPTVSLVAHFGHCSQELLNLCLVGVATPHVFDGYGNGAFARPLPSKSRVDAPGRGAGPRVVPYLV